MCVRQNSTQFSPPDIMQIPDSCPFPDQQEALRIFREDKKFIDDCIEKIASRGLGYSPVVIDGQSYILGKTRSCHVVQPIADWNASRKTGFCISFDNTFSACDEKPATMEAVRKYAHAILFAGRASRFEWHGGLF